MSAMGVNIDFSTFFADNNVDPVTISPEFQTMIPPDYGRVYTFMYTHTCERKNASLNRRGVKNDFLAQM